MIESGAIAAVAITFATYALHLVGGPDGARVPLAIAAIVVLSVINYLGVKPGSRVLNVLVVLKVAALAILIGAGVLRRRPSGLVDRDARRRRRRRRSTLVAFGAAMVPILFTYGGWQSANYVGEEIANPKRNLPARADRRHDRGRRHLRHRQRRLPARAGPERPGGDAPRRRRTRRGGCSAPSGDLFISGAIAISTFGFLDLSILAPTRVYYAMAADRLFVPALATLHPRYGTPSLAIVVQSTWSCILALTGSYDQLANYVVFADWIFFGLTVLTVLTFRRTLPLVAARRPTRSARPATRSSRSCSCSIAAAVVASVDRRRAGGGGEGRGPHRARHSGLLLVRAPDGARRTFRAVGDGHSACPPRVNLLDGDLGVHPGMDAALELHGSAPGEARRLRAAARRHEQVVSPGGCGTPGAAAHSGASGSCPPSGSPFNGGTNPPPNSATRVNVCVSPPRLVTVIAVPRSTSAWSLLKRHLSTRPFCPNSARKSPNVVSPPPTQVPGPTPAGGSALKVAGSQSSRCLIFRLSLAISTAIEASRYCGRAHAREQSSAEHLVSYP